MIPLSSPDITEAEIAAVTAVLRTPQLCMGPELAAFETALAEYHGVPHAVAVSSGTTATNSTTAHRSRRIRYRSTERKL